MIKCIVIRGGGDLATGVIHALVQSGLRCVVLEVPAPAAIRRKVALCEAVYQQQASVEGVTARLCGSAQQAAELLRQESGSVVPLLVDPECTFLAEASAAGIQVTALIDAIIAKQNLGTTKAMAPVTIALGPGFTAGSGPGADTDAVIETMRGHNLSRIITEGSAVPNTGVPGVIGGFSSERVIHAPAAGIIHLAHDIGDTVKKGEPLASIESAEGQVTVPASLDGILRGIIRDGYEVFNGMKIADIDPRISEQKNCFTISDKSRALGNSALHALLMIAHIKGVDIWNS